MSTATATKNANGTITLKWTTDIASSNPPVVYVYYSDKFTDRDGNNLERLNMLLETIDITTTKKEYIYTPSSSHKIFQFKIVEGDIEEIYSNEVIYEPLIYNSEIEIIESDESYNNIIDYYSFKINYSFEGYTDEYASMGYAGYKLKLYYSTSEDGEIFSDYILHPYYKDGSVDSDNFGEININIGSLLDFGHYIKFKLSVVPFYYENIEDVYIDLSDDIIFQRCTIEYDGCEVNGTPKTEYKPGEYVDFSEIWVDILIKCNRPDGSYYICESSHTYGDTLNSVENRPVTADDTSWKLVCNDPYLGDIYINHSILVRSYIVKIIKNPNNDSNYTVQECKVYTISNPNPNKAPSYTESMINVF